MMFMKFFVVSETYFTVSSVPVATQSSISTSTSSEMKVETKIKSEKDEDFNEFNSIDHSVQSMKVEFSKEPTTVEDESKRMFENPYNPLPMVHIENFELFGNYPEKENETVGNDIFYDGSASSNSSTVTSHSEKYESIIKIEAETFHSSAEYVGAGQTTVNSEENSVGCEVNEVKEEIPKPLTNQSEETQRECYICQQCGKDFNYFGNYSKHLEQHSIGKLMCKFCSQMFGSTYQIRKHIRDYHSNQEMFDCSVCFTTLPKHYFASHMRTHRSDDKTLICKYCGSRFSEPSELFYHFKNRHSDSSESNAAANSKSNEETVPFQPIEEVIGTEKFKCKYCGLLFDDVINMYHHVKVHIKHTGATKRMVRNHVSSTTEI